jgi:hypothetical protein
MGVTPGAYDYISQRGLANAPPDSDYYISQRTHNTMTINLQVEALEARVHALEQAILKALGNVLHPHSVTVAATPAVPPLVVKTSV